jgi:hypothetical protein
MVGSTETHIMEIVMPQCIRSLKIYGRKLAVLASLGIRDNASHN